eukprot:gene823-biopygen701
MLYRSSAKVKRGFCAKCGTPLTYQHPGGVELAIGAFDHPERFEPQIQVNHHQRLPWIDHLFEKPAYSSPEMEEFFASIESYQHPDHDTEQWPPEKKRVRLAGAGSVRSQHGRGSVFAIELALLRRAARPDADTTSEPHADADAASRHRTGTVLLIEDDPPQRLNRQPHTRRAYLDHPPMPGDYRPTHACKPHEPAPLNDVTHKTTHDLKDPARPHPTDAEHHNRTLGDHTSRNTSPE